MTAGSLFVNSESQKVSSGASGHFTRMLQKLKCAYNKGKHQTHNSSVGI